MKEPIRSRLQDSDEDVKLLGLSKNHIEPWEDGMRTDGSKGTYEWWYFDSHLDDGSKLVITLLTKSFVDVAQGLAPLATLQYDTQDGTHYEETLNIPISQFSAAKDSCDVHLGENSFVGDLHRYTIRVVGKTVQADVTLTGRVRSWRPDTGYITFGNKNEYYFAWLPSVPEGDVEATVSANGQTKHSTGTGYHDHNWGNVAMPQIMNHWYWGRARIGDYTVISAYITAEKKYGYNTFPVFMLAKDGEVIADNALQHLTFTASDEYIDEFTGKPGHKLLAYDYDDGKQHYKITYRRKDDIIRMKLADTLPRFKGVLARLVGFDGAYLRFTGTATLERIENGTTVETVSDPAIWELMYLGHTQKDR